VQALVPGLTAGTTDAPSYDSVEISCYAIIMPSYHVSFCWRNREDVTGSVCGKFEIDTTVVTLNLQGVTRKRRTIFPGPLAQEK
jgi:hypothetical protein